MQNQATLPNSNSIGMGLGAGALFFIWVFASKKWHSRHPVLPLFFLVLSGFLAGFYSAAYRADIRLSESLSTAVEGRDIQIVGIIADLPQHFSEGTRFTFEVEKSNEPTPSRVLLFWYDTPENAENSAPTLRPGDRFQLSVRLKKPHGNVNPGGFDYEYWLLERGIRATGQVRSSPAPIYLGQEKSIGHHIDALRQKIRENFYAVLPLSDYPYAGILIALITGEQNAIDTAQWTVLNRTGTTHLFAISGMHITLIAVLLGGILGFFWRRVPALALRYPAQRVALLAACLAAFGYSLLAGFGVPAQRTLFMLFGVAAAQWCNRLIAPSQSLAIALLAVLIFDPWAVLSAGFWLSFCAVGALLYIGQSSVEAIETKGDRGIRAKARTAFHAGIKNWRRAQWAATLGTLPILLAVFQQFSLVSLPANAIAIPIVSLLVTPLALLAAVFVLVFPPLVWPLGFVAHALLSGLFFVLDYLAMLPLWQVAASPAWTAVLAVIGVALLLLPPAVALRGLGVFFLIPLLFWQSSTVEEGSAEIVLLDVGQGLSVLVRTREKSLLYDTGPRYSPVADAGQRVVLPYLRWLGLQRLDTLIVTHRDSDHAGGAASVLASLPVEKTLSSVPEMGGIPCIAGQKWQWNGVHFEMLYPFSAAKSKSVALNEEPKKRQKTNSESCVLKISTGKNSLLLTSDIESADEIALLSESADRLAATVLLVPHHGSGTSSTVAFLKAVGAKDMLIAVGYRNRYQHPKDSVLERLRATGASIWQSDNEGAITLQLRADTYEISRARQSKARYWLLRSAQNAQIAAALVD